MIEKRSKNINDSGMRASPQRCCVGPEDFIFSFYQLSLYNFHSFYIRFLSLSVFPASLSSADKGNKVSLSNIQAKHSGVLLEYRFIIHIKYEESSTIFSSRFCTYLLPFDLHVAKAKVLFLYCPDRGSALFFTHCCFCGITNHH